jgi:hypothetical protein
MVYFIINLIAHLAVSVLLLLIIMRFVSNNRQHKNKKGISFLLPVFVTVIFLMQVMSFSVPRVLDSVSIIKKSYNTVTGRVESVGFLNNSILVDGKTYYYNPFLYNPREGDLLEISYTPYARYIADLTALPW